MEYEKNVSLMILLSSQVTLSALRLGQSEGKYNLQAPFSFQFFFFVRTPVSGRWNARDLIFETVESRED